MQVNTAERSRYVNTTAQQVAHAWRNHILAINVVAIFLVLFLAGSIVLMPHPKLGSILLTIVGYACVYAAQRLLKMRETTEVMKIVSHDSDPSKLAQVIDEMLPKTRDRRSRQLLSTSYSMCSELMGYDDVALAWADQVEAQAPKDKNLLLALISVRAAIAKHRCDDATLVSLRDRALAVESASRQGTPLERSANMVLGIIDRHRAFLSGDFARVRELNGVIEALATTPQAVIVSEGNKGELEDAQGNVEQAWPHFAYVANNGGTLAVRAKAIAWLEEHDPRRDASPVAPVDEGACDADSQG